MISQIHELISEELDTVSGGGFDIGRPFLPQIISKPASDPKPTGSSTTTLYPSASFDPVKVKF